MGYYGSIKEVPSTEATYGCNCVDGHCSDCGNCCFEEFGDETITDVANYLIMNGVTMTEPPKEAAP